MKAQMPRKNAPIIIKYKLIKASKKPDLYNQIDLRNT